MTGAEIIRIIKMREKGLAYGQISDLIYGSKNRKGDVWRVCRIFNAMIAMRNAEKRYMGVATSAAAVGGMIAGSAIAMIIRSI